MSGPWVAMSVRIFVDLDGTVVIVPPDADFTPKEGMKEVLGVRDIDIRMHLGEVVTATIKLFAGGMLYTGVRPIWVVIAPDGEQREVKRIEFADGTEWNWAI